MKRSMNRRMFLRGAGGATLALPFLPSLTTRAFATEDPLPPVGRCFMGFGTFQGEVWGGNIYPSDTLFTQETEYASRMVRSGDLFRHYLCKNVNTGSFETLYSRC